MIVVIKKDCSTVTFKLGDIGAEKEYIKRFEAMPEHGRLTLDYKGNHPKNDIYLLLLVKDQEEAEKKSMEFFKFIRKVFSK
jgi:hypothetical protein